jgi:N-carbamoyl-L-amino-acid hydrolase
VRAYDEEVLAAIEARLPALITRIEAERRVNFDLGRQASAAVGLVDTRIYEGLSEAASRLGISAMPLGSPASHDAAAFAAAGTPTAMLFVRNRNGSHNPDEQMDLDDFLDACAVLTEWVARNAV